MYAFIFQSLRRMPTNVAIDLEGTSPIVNINGKLYNRPHQIQREVAGSRVLISLSCVESSFPLLRGQ